jgi:O-antigen/teichoic acid export membrane protein
MSLRSAISSNSSRRFIRGLGATALGPVVTAAIQLGPVPLLIHAWGAAKYGDWLLLSAIPSYLSLTDLGFGDASGSDMTVRVAAGDRDGALRTFQSSWALFIAISALVILLVCGSVWWMPWQQWFRLSSLSSSGAAMVIFILAVYAVVGQQTGILESGFRCDGNFALGVAYVTMLRLVEAIVACAVGILTKNLAYVALAYLCTRCISLLGYGFLLHCKSPWLSLGFRHARMSTIRELIPPAAGFVAFPLGYAINLQGFTLLIGTLLGPVAVTAFSTLRTLAKVNFQVMGTIGWAVWPEISAAFGAGKQSLARTLHRRACQAAIALAVLGGVTLWIVGPAIYRVWIHNAVPFNATCFHILLVVTLANCFWFVSSVVPMSVNVHHRLAFAYVGLASVSLLLAAFLIPLLGLNGAACALTFADFCMICLVLRVSLRQLNESSSDFVRALFILPLWRRESIRTVEVRGNASLDNCCQAATETTRSHRI